VAGWSADPTAGQLAQSTVAATEPSAAAMDPPAAQELEVQAAGCLKIVAVEASARCRPELDHCNWLALAALMRKMHLQAVGGSATQDLVQPRMHPLDPGHHWLHHWALVRAAMPGALAAPGNGMVQPAAQCKQATFYKVRKILAQNFRYHMQIHLNSPLGFPLSVLPTDAWRLGCLAAKAAATQELKPWDSLTAEAS